MDTDLLAYVRIILRWSWVTIILVASVVAVILYAHANVAPIYTATVKLEVSAPEPEEVALFSTVRAGATREEISAVQANFSVIVRSAMAAWMTIDALDLPMSMQELQDKIYTEIPPFSDFVYVHVQADNPEDAATIARVHTDNALKYFGEARAKTTTVRRQFIIEQLQTAGKDLADARESLLRFQIKNGLADLSREIQAYQDTLRSLRLDRDRNLVEIERATAAADYYTAQAEKAAAQNDNTAAAGYRASAAASQSIVEGMKSAVTRLNEVIAQRENDLLALVSLSTDYDRLRSEVQRAENNYNFLLGKLNEATIKENDARSAGFIQIVEPAQVPTRAERPQTRNMLIPGVAASVIGGIVLSFVLEYIFGRARRRET